MAIIFFFIGTTLLSQLSNTKSLYELIMYLIFILIVTFIQFFYKVLTRANFHYSFDDAFLVARYGILSKKNRTLPYGIIQNITVKQGLTDRIFGLATLRIENAASAGSQAFPAASSAANKIAARQPDVIGSYGNLISIPGLKKEHAEYLKSVLYEKIKLHPVVEQGL